MLHELSMKLESRNSKEGRIDRVTMPRKRCDTMDVMAEEKPTVTLRFFRENWRY